VLVHALPGTPTITVSVPSAQWAHRQIETKADAIVRMAKFSILPHLHAPHALPTRMFPRINLCACVIQVSATSVGAVLHRNPAQPTKYSTEASASASMGMPTVMVCAHSAHLVLRQVLTKPVAFANQGKVLT
jgi:hypothetical protein